MRHALNRRIGGPFLIESKLIRANATSVMFNDLAGDADGIYLFSAKIKNNSGTAPFYALRPNGLTSNLRCRLSYNSAGGFAAEASNTGRAFFSQGNADQVVVNITIFANKVAGEVAQNVLWTGTGNAQDTANSTLVTFFISGIWLETAIQMISLEVVCESANGIGAGSQLFLYKYPQ